MAQDLEQPSPPPEMRRRFRLYRSQVIGIPFVFLLPVVLALAGAFGEAWRTVRAETSAVAATISYPSRYRYKQLNTMEVWVANVSTALIDTVTIAIDTAYASRFSTVTSIPDFTLPYSIDLLDIPPGERRLAIIELQGERYGTHEGEVRVIAGDTATLRVRTTIFP
jgi:hypothetical protein